MTQTSSVINLITEREKRDGPSPEHVVRDADGDRWFEFTASYPDPVSEKSYSLSFWARDFDDAERRIGLISAGLVLDGQIYATQSE